MGERPKKYKFKIVKAHWTKMKRFGFKVDDDSGFWYFIRFIFQDGAKRIYGKPFKTFNEALSVCVDFLSILRVEKIISSKAESEARYLYLKQKERKQKDPWRFIYVAAAITTIIDFSIDIGIRVYSTLTQKKSSNSITQDKETILNKEEKKKHLSENANNRLKTIIKNNIGMEFVLIPAGSFMMGSKLSPEEVTKKYGGWAELWQSEHPQHKVTISKPFYLQTTEVTQGQWQKVMGYNSYNYKFWRNDCPVETVSWDNVQDFIKKLNKTDITDNKYRLPTEAEWEYACRAGTTTEFFFGDDAGQLDEYAWFDKNSNKKTHPAGTKKSNPWGLYDMPGNVWEWVEDDWHGTYEKAPDDGRAWIDEPRGTARVVRGGGWSGVAGNCRSAYRFYGAPGYRDTDFGFRLARSVTLGS